MERGTHPFNPLALSLLDTKCTLRELLVCLSRPYYSLFRWSTCPHHGTWPQWSCPGRRSLVLLSPLRNGSNWNENKRRMSVCSSQQWTYQTVPHISSTRWTRKSPCPVIAQVGVDLFGRSFQSSRCMTSCLSFAAVASAQFIMFPWTPTSLR